jgi:predicted nucleic acid-binding protein
VARYIVLDSTPLGLASTRRGQSRWDACRAWLDGLRQAGVRVVVPEVADYEVRRELLRVNAVAGLRRLDALAAGLIYDPITTAVMRMAAGFWADVRRRGLPTAADLSLDGDAILAAQAILIGAPGDVVEIATANAAHLSRFPGVNAREWATIV